MSTQMKQPANRAPRGNAKQTIASTPEEARRNVRRAKFAYAEPRTPLELWEYFYNVYGIRIPTVACSEDKHAPMEALWAVHAEINSHTLLLANRGGSKTYSIVALLRMKCETRNDYQAVHVSAQRSQSRAAQKYLREFARDQVLGANMTTLSLSRAEWRNGASWEIFTGTASGVSGQHPQFLSVDELEFWSTDAYDQVLGLPVDRFGYKAQFVGFSTRQSASSLMHRLVSLAKRDITPTGRVPMKLYEWSCFETMKRCPSCVCIKGGRVVSNPREHCALWEFCKGEKGIKSDGWIPRSYYENLADNMTPEAFAVQYACTEPQTYGLVMHNYVPAYPTALDVHKGNHLDWVYQPELPLYVCHDPGEGHVSALVFYQIWRDRVFFFDEIVLEKCATIGPVKIALYERCLQKGYTLSPLVVVDPHRPDAMQDWRAGSVVGEGEGRAYSTATVDTKRDSYGVSYNATEPGYALVRALISNGRGHRRLFVHPQNCPRINTAMEQHAYKVAPKTKIPTQIPSKTFKDETDVVRYGCIHAVQTGALALFRDEKFAIFPN